MRLAINPRQREIQSMRANGEDWVALNSRGRIVSGSMWLLLRISGALKQSKPECCYYEAA